LEDERGNPKGGRQIAAEETAVVTEGEEGALGRERKEGAVESHRGGSAAEGGKENVPRPEGAYEVKVSQSGISWRKIARKPEMW